MRLGIAGACGGRDYETHRGQAKVEPSKAHQELRDQDLIGNQTRVQAKVLFRALCLGLLDGLISGKFPQRPIPGTQSPHLHSRASGLGASPAVASGKSLSDKSVAQSSDVRSLHCHGGQSQSLLRVHLRGLPGQRSSFPTFHERVWDIHKHRLTYLDTVIPECMKWAGLRFPCVHFFTWRYLAHRSTEIYSLPPFCPLLSPSCLRDNFKCWDCVGGKSCYE